jgi:predicted O-methyltransferase YrrM
MNFIINKFKKRFGHWTPRYIYNRIKLMIDEFLRPQWPWLTKEAILLLERLLRPDDIGLEFGSGRSTIWFAERVQKLISVEHGIYWIEKINKKLKEKGLVRKVDYRLANEDNYLDILNEIENNSIYFVLVYGLQRDICSLKSIQKLKIGGLLIIDNINWFVPNKSYFPSSKRDNNFESQIWQDIWEKEIKNWRKVWTLNGVTDTLIAFKK